MSNDAGWYTDLHSDRRRISVDEILRAKKHRRIYAAYKAMFFENGQLKDDAKIVLKDLVEASAIGEMRADLSNDALRELFGRRKIVLHVINRLDRDGTKVDQLTQAIRESGNE